MPACSGGHRVAVTAVARVVGLERVDLYVLHARVRHAREIVLDVSRTRDAHEHRLALTRLGTDLDLAEVVRVGERIGPVQVHVDVVGGECAAAGLEAVRVRRQIAVTALLRVAP